MELCEKIKLLRQKHGLTLEEVGNAVGVGKSTVRKWENGMIANMRRDKIARLAQALHTTPAYLMGWDEAGFSSDTPSLSHAAVKALPLLGEIACGQPVFASESHESYIMADFGIPADFCLQAHGDSMAGARIQDGDIVFIRKQSIVENGEIAAVIIDDEATLKRVSYFPEKNMLILKAENPKYPDFVYTGEELERIHILGKAVAFQSRIE